MTRPHRQFRYVPFALVLDYELLGWVHDARPMPGGHAEWSVVCWWLCDCPMREPKR
jgi:hypothetical protein